MTDARVVSAIDMNALEILSGDLKMTDCLNEILI